MSNFIFRQQFRSARWTQLVLAAAVILTLGTAPSWAQAQDEPLDVLATTGMIADVAANLAGSCADVGAMMGPGIDPHLYQGSASDVRNMQRADLILYSGYSLEGQLGEVLDRFGNQKPVLAVAPSSIAVDQLIAVQGVYGIDPHVWMDVAMWSQTVAPIADTLAGLRPQCEDAIRANADRYHAELTALHAWVVEAVATIPEEQRILVTAHDAFAYYGRAYGIDVSGIQGISTEAEAGIGDIRATIDLVIERQVPALFVESTINPRTVEAVIEAAADRGHQIVVGAELFSDAMGQAGTADGTYIGMLYHNTRAIVNALGGTTPPLPEALRAWSETWRVENP